MRTTEDDWDDLDSFAPEGFDQAYGAERREGGDPFSPQGDSNGVTPQQMEMAFAQLPPDMQQSFIRGLSSDPLAASALLAVLGPSFGGVISQIMQAASIIGPAPGLGGMPGGMAGGMPPGGAGGPPPPLAEDIGAPPGPPMGGPPPAGGGAGAAAIGAPPPAGGGGSAPPGPPPPQGQNRQPPPSRR